MTKYLRLLKLRLYEFSLNGHTQIEPSERLNRFITVKRWVDKENKPKQQAFLPALNGDFGTSVYRSKGASVERLLRIGRLIAGGTKDKVLFGRAVIRAEKITSAKPVPLSLKGAVIPGLHRDLVGWPKAHDHKGLHKLIAEYLASESVFVPTS